MILLKYFKNTRIERLLQLTAHPSYIILGWAFFYGYQRPLSYYPMLMVANYFFYAATMFIANKLFEKKEDLISLTPIIMAGNILLNMEAYRFTTYALAGLIGAVSRAFLKNKKAHIFNPGYFGFFAVAMLFPESGHTSLGLWKSNLAFVIFIFLLGNLVVYKAQRLRVVWGYLLGFSAVAIFFSILSKSTGIHYFGLDEVPVLFWPTSLLTVTSFVFTFHVISDPKTSPLKSSHQIIFGCLIGLIDFVLRASLIMPAEAISYVLVQAMYGIYCANSSVELAITEEKLIPNQVLATN